jgi:membrane associated rhomboid family serine protease
VHRINTYPVIHTGALHAGVNLIVLTPLLERFEREIGTLKTTLLIAGRKISYLLQFIVYMLTLILVKRW